MGLDQLIGRLERDADARVADVEARARAEVEAIEASAGRVAAHARDDALARRHAERRARLDREVSAARRHARGARLRAELALLDRVLARAASLLDGAERDAAYVSALPRRLQDALRFVEPRESLVRCRPAMAVAVRDATAGRHDVAIEEVPAMAAGFTVAARDGSVEVDDTLPARLERARPRLLIELLAEVDL